MQIRNLVAAGLAGSLLIPAAADAATKPVFRGPPPKGQLDGVAGPAFVLIPIGLAMLSLEFVWAERMLEHALERAEIAKEKAAQTTRTQRIFGTVAGALAAAAAVAAAIMWDIPLVPVL